MRHIIWIFYGWIVEKYVERRMENPFLLRLIFLLPPLSSLAYCHSHTQHFHLFFIYHLQWEVVLLKALMWRWKEKKVWFHTFWKEFWHVSGWISDCEGFFFLLSSYPLDNFISLTCFASLLFIPFLEMRLDGKERFEFWENIFLKLHQNINLDTWEWKCFNI